MYCNKCGARAEADQAFCGSCGTALVEPPVAAPIPPRTIPQPSGEKKVSGSSSRISGWLIVLAAAVVAIAIVVTHLIDNAHEQDVVAQDGRTLAQAKAADTKILAAQKAKDQKTIAELQARLGVASNERDVAQHQADVNYGAGIILASQVKACQAALYWVTEAIKDAHNGDTDSMNDDLGSAESQLNDCVPQTQ
jgi:hypothetical protein